MQHRMALKFDDVADLSTEYDAKIEHVNIPGCVGHESQDRSNSRTMEYNRSAVVRFIVISVSTPAAG